MVMFPRNHPKGSKRRAEHPGGELFVAHPSQFALCSLSAGDRNNFFKNPMTDLFHRFLSVEDRSRIEIHIVVHPIEERGVGRHLNARGRFATVDASPTGGEDADVASSRDEASHADGIKPGRIHKTKARRLDMFGILIHGGER